VANFAPELGVVELPFLIRDFAHADRVFMGPIGKDLCDKVTASSGSKCLGLWENGFRSLVNNKRPINSVEDIKGLKIRTMENSAHQALWKALGADPVPMAWGDAYTAVQQGALDGLENAITLLYSLKTNEISKYLAVTEHLYSPAVVLMQQDIWDGMTPEDQKVFQDSFNEVSIYEREVSRSDAGKAEEGLANQGMEVTHPDKEGFRKATEQVKAELSKNFTDIVAQIEAQ
jgi:tripartite ATP-independent transporter DctP family solute receptor